MQTEADMVASIYGRLGATVGSTINQLAQGMGQLVENWVLYGNASGMSARKAIAAALGMAAAQSAVSAIMETAYGIAALTPWGAAIYGPAVFHFKAAALFGAIAAGTALAGRAVAGNSFSGGGGSSQANQPDYNPVGSPNVRNTSANLSAGSSQNAEYTAVFKGLRDQIGMLQDRIGSMRPGDVLTVGAKEKPGFIGRQTAEDIKRNGSLATDLGKGLRLN